MSSSQEATWEKQSKMEQIKAVADQGPVVQTMDSAIHRINHYPVDKH